MRFRVIRNAKWFNRFSSFHSDHPHYRAAHPTTWKPRLSPLLRWRWSCFWADRAARRARIVTRANALEWIRLNARNSDRAFLWVTSSGSSSSVNIRLPLENYELLIAQRPCFSSTEEPIVKPGTRVWVSITYGIDALYMSPFITFLIYAMNFGARKPTKRGRAESDFSAGLNQSKVSFSFWRLIVAKRFKGRSLCLKSNIRSLKIEKNFFLS